MVFFLSLLVALLLGWGVWRIAAAVLWHDRSSVGANSIRQIRKWYQDRQEFWDRPLIKKAIGFLSRWVFLDDATRLDLQRKLRRAGLTELTPEQFTARKYVVCALCAVGVLLCALIRFWFGVILCVLLLVFGMMRLRESLTKKIRARDEAIEMEMPRFVRTICRTLRSSRDIYAALSSYYKVSGPILGQELYILLTQMRTGGIAAALQDFQKRIGTDSAYRLCGMLQEIDRGIDQSSALEYLSDDMARQAKLIIQKKLSTRPGKMRLTYLPAVGVCVAMIIYVLVVFVIHQLDNLF